MKKLLVLTLVLAFVGSVQAFDLATNGGFETGDLTNWATTTDGTFTATVNSGGAQEGTYYEQTVLTAGTYAGVENVIGVYGAGPLEASVWLRNTSGTGIVVEFGCDYGTTDGLQPWWYGQNIVSFTVPANTAWTEYTMLEGYAGNTVSGRSGSGWPAGLEVVYDAMGRPTEASQAGYGNNMKMMVKVVSKTVGVGLDADRLVVTPEPATLALLGLGGLFLRRRNK